MKVSGTSNKYQVRYKQTISTKNVYYKKQQIRKNITTAGV